ncbi:hypothetical protein U9M48_009500 [Paspalum notatum var. saurae]|uniref:F-box domain-containing protein n=1 Tax=Paspalum notatum var. saurae TaxID=547442 RepID=A0AAQ3WEW9_PASNO
MEIQTFACSWQPAAPATRDGTDGWPYSDQPRQPADIISQGACSTIPYDELPEDVLQHIHSFVRMQDAARAACVSRTFLHLWRCYPNLAFNEETLAVSRQPLLESEDDRSKYVFSKAQQVLEKHSGIGVKTLKINLSTCSMEDIDSSLLDGWLRVFIKPGLSELAVSLPECRSSVPEYIFPYSLLSHGSNSGTIRSLCLASCALHPTQCPRLLGCSMSLSKVCLRRVGITGDELWLFLSSCLALESLDLSNCDMIASLKIPCVLRKLRIVRVLLCKALGTIDNYAPKLSTFAYDGKPLLRLTLGDKLETKELDMHTTRMRHMIQYAATNLPTVAPNLETLVLTTDHEKLKAPVMTDKFQHLKHLAICLGKTGGICAGHDLFSLAFFLDACVALETFILRIEDLFGWNTQYYLYPGTPYGDLSQEIPEFRHGGLGKLRKVTITGFCSAKSLVELTCHILETAAPSLQRLVLDTSPGYDRKRSSSDRCRPMFVEARWDAERALANVRRYVEPKVPTGVELKVLGPCSRCHTIERCLAMEIESLGLEPVVKDVEEFRQKAPLKFLQIQEDGTLGYVIKQPRG